MGGWWRGNEHQVWLFLFEQLAWIGIVSWDRILGFKCSGAALVNIRDSHERNALTCRLHCFHVLHSDSARANDGGAILLHACSSIFSSN